MTDARRKWLDDDGDTLIRPEETPSRVRVGARMECRQIDFRPRPGNLLFNGGRGKSVEYGYLIYIDYEPDFSELALTFCHYRVIVRGHNLQGLLHQIQAHHASLVEETADPLHEARARGDAMLVTGLALEPRDDAEEG